MWGPFKADDLHIGEQTARRAVLIRVQTLNEESLELAILSNFGKHLGKSEFLAFYVSRILP